MSARRPADVITAELANKVTPLVVLADEIDRCAFIVSPSVAALIDDAKASIPLVQALFVELGEAIAPRAHEVVTYYAPHCHRVVDAARRAYPLRVFDARFYAPSAPGQPWVSLTADAEVHAFVRGYIAAMEES